MFYLLPEIYLCALGCAALIVACVPTKRRIVGLAISGGVGALLAAVATAFLADDAASLPASELTASLPIYLRTTYAIDPFSRYFALLAVLVCGIAYLLSLEYIRDRLEDHEPEFLSFLAFASLAMCSLASGRDILTVWFSIELLSVSGYVMAAFLRAEERSIEAAVKYFLLGAVSSALMLFGLSYLYGITGRLDLAAIGLALQEGTVGPILPAALLLILVGFGFKIAMVPFHMWCPDVYEGAPTPVTAFLSVGPKLAGFAALARVLTVAFSGVEAHQAWVAILSILAVVTMTLGNLVALRQQNLKRLLAYSSIAHAGYLLAAIVVLGQSAFALPGLVLYAAAYVFMNLGAFAVVLGVSHGTGDDRLQAYEGMAARSPYLAAAWILFALSLVGIPPTSGFFGKLYVLAATVDAKLYWLGLAIVLNSMVSLYYYFEVARRMYFRPARNPARIPVGGGVGTAIGIALAGTVALVLFLGPIADALGAIAAL